MRRNGWGMMPSWDFRSRRRIKGRREGEMEWKEGWET